MQRLKRASDRSSATVRPAYGNSYGGMLDTIEWTNPEPGTYPDLTTTDPAVALAALADQDHLAASVRANRAGMQQLVAGLRALRLAFIPSVGNFVAVDVRRDAGRVYEQLLREGVIVRPVENYAMPGYLRISIGLEEENARLLATLERVL